MALNQLTFDSHLRNGRLYPKGQAVSDSNPRDGARWIWVRIRTPIPPPPKTLTYLTCEKSVSGKRK